jgi:hypothetical protein
LLDAELGATIVAAVVNEALFSSLCAAQMRGLFYSYPLARVRLYSDRLEIKVLVETIPLKRSDLADVS